MGVSAIKVNVECGGLSPQSVSENERVAGVRETVVAGGGGDAKIKSE